MPNPTVTVVGSYPKPPHEGKEFRLRKVLQGLDRDQATLEDVRSAEDELVREIIQEQIAAGVELLTDGQVRWDDGLTRFAGEMEGFSIGGLIRFFDTNTYFRQPVVKGAVTRRSGIVVDEFRFAREVSSVPVKAVVTGPYTLAALSRDEHYQSTAALVQDLAVALNEEAKDLVSAGASVVQFDEPALARVPGSRPGDLDVFAEVASSLVDGVGATTVLQTYFGDIVEHGPDFFSLPFDVFGLDLVAGRSNVEAIHEFPSQKVLSAGIVDARNTKLESMEALVETMRDLNEAVPPERLWVAPSCGLEFLPREAANRKCWRLAEAAGRFTEGA
jgi:5-methyltetrahydropteroyltriglutamate--homocysteine methyltransferase